MKSYKPAQFVILTVELKLEAKIVSAEVKVLEVLVTILELVWVVVEVKVLVLLVTIIELVVVKVVLEVLEVIEVLVTILELVWVVMVEVEVLVVLEVRHDALCNNFK